jgi:hypothetical protein
MTSLPKSLTTDFDTMPPLSTISEPPKLTTVPTAIAPAAISAVPWSVVELIAGRYV